jgi:hypothetical protein
MVKNSFPPSVRTQYICITKTNQLLQFRDLIAVYNENSTKHTNTRCEESKNFLNNEPDAKHANQ